MRCHAPTPPRPGPPLRVDHEDARGSALAYLAARAGRRGGVLGRRETTTGTISFGWPVAQVRPQDPDRAAPRVFRVVDNGGSHRGAAACQRLQARYPNPPLVQLPTRASWLTRIARPCARVQRNVLTPNDSPDRAAVATRVLAFAARYNDTALPSHRRFTRQQRNDRLAASPDRPPPRTTALPPPPPVATANARTA